MVSKEHIKAICSSTLSLAVLLALLAPSLHHLSSHESHDAHGHNHKLDTICSEEAEQDPCHRKLVHDDDSNGCTHDSHVSEEVKACSLCAITTLRLDANAANSQSHWVIQLQSSALISSYQQLYLTKHPTSNESRGPPLA